jgi:hypothetical protein
MSEAWIHCTRNIPGNVRERKIKQSLGFTGMNDAGG